MQGIQEISEYLLLPIIHDRLSEIEYILAGNHKKDLPTKLVDIVLGKEEKGKKRDTTRSYMSVDDFNKSRYGGA